MVKHLGIAAAAWFLLPSVFATVPLPIHVNIRDGITGQSIPAAQVRVGARQEIVRADGSIQLASLDSSMELASGQTDRQGLCKLVLSSSPAFRWLVIECQASGYLEHTISLAKAVEGATNFYALDLMPGEVSPGEAIQLEQKQGMERLGLWLKYSDIDQRETYSHPMERPGELPRESSPPTHAFSGYPVPEQVYVKDLAEVDFTGWMDLDELVAGTVTAEMNDGFPLEALKAQAVASRTYSLDHLRRRGQANGGQAYTPRTGVKSLTATRNTASIVLLYGGLPITAYYSARCNGDYTLNSEEGPTLSDCRIGALGAGIVPWARSRPCSGHVSCAVTGEACCEIAVRGQIHHIYGHGVGLCQRGAQDLAGRDGWSWDSILTNYYTDIVIANGYGLSVGHTVVTTTRVNLRNSACGTSILATIPIGTRGVIVGGPQRPACSLVSPSSHLTWWEVSLSTGQRGWMAEDYLRLIQTVPLVLRLDWQKANGQLILSWPSNNLDLVLQQTMRLSTGVFWSTPPLPLSFSNGVFRAKVETTNEIQFYRLMTR